MMLARTCILTIALGVVALAAPGGLSPANEAAAYCIQIEGVDDCLNPCLEAGGAYQAARDATGMGDETPDLVCAL